MEGAHNGSVESRQLAVTHEPPTEAAKLTILIVTWNACDVLDACLRSIARHLGPQNFPVVIVDNCSTDGTLAMLRREHPQTRLISSASNLGFAKANNSALCEIDTPYVLLLNPDTVVEDDSIIRMLRAIESRPETALVGCRLVDGRHVTQPLGLQWFPSAGTEGLSSFLLSSGLQKSLRRLLPYQDPNKSGRVLKLYGACILCRLSSLREVDFFDERFFMYCEDVDLCRRLLDTRWELYYLATASVVHLGGQSTSRRGTEFAAAMMCASVRKYIAKHSGDNGAVLYRLVVALGAVARLFVAGTGQLLRVLVQFGILPPRDRPFGARLDKYRAMIKWSLGFRK